jgi:hypothetical protein
MLPVRAADCGMEGMRIMRGSVARAAGLAAALALGFAPGQAGAAGEQFSSYPSYSAKFDLVTGKFSLITSVVVYNLSGSTLTDVAFKQVYPEGVTVSETYQRDAGTAQMGEQSSADRAIRENTHFASIASYKNRQFVVLFNELKMARRLDQVTFPGVEISYTDPAGAKQTTRLPDSTYDLFSLSNVVGGLERYLRKQNYITFDFAKAVPNRTEWEFAPIVASAQGRFPTGIIQSFPGETRYDGYFRIRSGAPGNTLQILVVYNRIDGKEFVADQDALMKRLGKYLEWCGEFKFSDQGLSVTQGKWKKNKDAWLAEGRWIDNIKDRLGEGPFKARAFFGAREDVEYFLLGLVHGRGFGAEGSAIANPEKEAALMAELDALMETFRTYITPLSYDR